MEENENKEKKSNIKIILDWVQKHKVFLTLISLTLVLIFLGAPFFNYIATNKWEWQFINENNYDAWIGYYGAIIGGSLTLLGVYWTLNDQQKQFKDNIDEQRKLYEATVRPNICLSVIHTPEGVPYLRAKNFGNSNAKIIKFEINFNVPEQKDAFPEFPLINTRNLVLAPQQFIAGIIEENYLISSHIVTVIYEDEVGHEYRNSINLSSSNLSSFYISNDYDYLK